MVPVTRRRTSYPIRIGQMFGTAAALAVPAVLLHALFAWIFWIR